MAPPGLSQQESLWLLKRLQCAEPQRELDRIRQGACSLEEACLSLITGGAKLSDNGFVRRLYQQLLGREPDEAGLRDNIDALSKGLMTRPEVLNAFLSSEELQRVLARLSKAGALDVDDDSVASRMERDWDERARQNALFFIDTYHSENVGEFEKSGEWDLENHILRDIELDPQATVLEIGCGIGRLLKPLCPRVAAVIGIDISGEMVQRARAWLAPFPNVRICKTDGSLSLIEGSSIDFCFCYVVFQHFPRKEPVFTYFREAARALRPGGIFRFQVNERPEKFSNMHVADTWDGVGLAHREVTAGLEEAGFAVLDSWGEMTHYAWYTAEEARKVRAPGWTARADFRKVDINPASLLEAFQGFGRTLQRGEIESILSRRLPLRQALDFVVTDFVSRGDDDFIRSVHRVLLNRDIDPALLNANAAQMKDGRLSRSIFLDSLVSSKEFRDILARR